MINKKLTAAMMLGLALTFGNVYNTSIVAASGTEANVAVSVNMYQNGTVNWTKGAESDIVAIGVGYPPENVGNRGNILARRAAIVDAYRLLAETIQGVQVDSETTVESLVLQSDVVKARVSALVKGAHVIEEGSNEDGSYFVKLRIPLFGTGNSLANAVLPEVTKNVKKEPAIKIDTKTTVLSKDVIQEIKTVNYTGVIVDASNLGLEATFAPVIYDKNGRAIYGIQNIDKDFAISKGMVEYAADLQKAAGGFTRAGNNPLIVKALAVKGGLNSVNPVNVVVSVEDGDKILLANEQADIFNQCAVVFVK